jgi:polar amino acid transport system substrate-binding protein
MMMGMKFLSTGSVDRRSSETRGAKRKASSFGAFFRATAMVAALVGPGLTTVSSALAGPLLDKINAGEPIRIGYSNARPACFPDANNQLTGLTADITLAVLKQMGHEKIETVGVADFGSLIPGLAAKRFDIAICGMYIRAERCKNVAFSDPLAQVSDLFVLPAGNPKGINTWPDVVKTGSSMVYVQATVSREDALEADVEESKLIAVPSSTELAGAITSGRADVGHLFAWDAGELVKAFPGKIETVDPGIADKTNWSSNGFHHDDADFIKLYNEAQAKYMQSPEMLAVLEKYGLDKSSIPDPTVTADWVCTNR